MPAEETVRKQYLIPTRLDRKVRAMSKRQKVPATEIVRRALDAYTDTKPEVVNEDELVDRLLTEAFETLEQVSTTVDVLNHQLASVQQRIESGEIRRQVETEMRQWIAENPKAVRAFQKTLKQEASRAARQ